MKKILGLIIIAALLTTAIFCATASAAINEDPAPASGPLGPNELAGDGIPDGSNLESPNGPNAPNTESTPIGSTIN